MGRFRIGRGEKQEKKVIQPAIMQQELPIAQPLNVVTIEDLEKRLSTIQIPVEIPSEKIIEKTEVIKELVSIKTKDQRARQLSKLIRRKMDEIESQSHRLHKKMQQIQDDAVISRKIDHASLSSIVSQLKELQAAHLHLKTEIDKEIQQLKIPRMHPITIGCLAISIGLSLVALLLK